jgi:hypothetical protein
MNTVGEVLSVVIILAAGLVAIKFRNELASLMGHYVASGRSPAFVVTVVIFVAVAALAVLLVLSGLI